MEMVEMENNDEVVMVMDMDMDNLQPQENVDLARNNVFGNPLIFLKILRYLPHLDVMECRKVSRWWCQLATDTLGSSGHLQFEYSDALGCFIRTRRQINQRLTPEVRRDYLLPSFWYPSLSYTDRHEQLFLKGDTFIEDHYTLHAFTKFVSEYEGDELLLTPIKLGLWGYNDGSHPRNSLMFSSETEVTSRKRDVEQFLSAHGSKVVELGIDLFAQHRRIFGSLEFLTSLLLRMPNLQKIHIGVVGTFMIQTDIERQYEGFRNRMRIGRRHGPGPFHDRAMDHDPGFDPLPDPLTRFSDRMSTVTLPKLEVLLWTIKDEEGQEKDNGQGQGQGQTHDPWFSRFLACLVNSAPNLQRNCRVPCRPCIQSYWRDYVPSQRVTSVHRMTFKPHPENVDLYMKFANGGPQLSTIIFDLTTAREIIKDEELGPGFKKQVNLILRKILESSRLTLKKVLGRDEVEALDFISELVHYLPENSDDDQGQTQTPGQVKVEVAQNPENCPLPNIVMTKILGNLPTALLLKTTRLVSRQWREISNQILIQRRSVRINFVHYSQHHRFIWHCSNNSGTNGGTNNNPTICPDVMRSEFTEDFPTLHKFNDCLQRVGTATLFPCIRFGFYNNMLSSRDFKEFIKVYGSKVKELELEVEVWNMKACLTQILSLVQGQTTNLEVLTLIRDFDRRRSGRKESEKSPSRLIVSPISALKTLKIGSNDHETFWIGQLSDIISSRGLKLEYRNIDPVTCTIDSLTPDILCTHLELKVPDSPVPEMDIFLQKMEEYADFGPKLWSFNFDLKAGVSLSSEVKTRLSAAVKKILLENTKSLTDLQGLQQLQLLGDQSDCNRNFLSDFSFPYIHALTLSHGKLRETEQLIETRDTSKKAKLSASFLPRGCDLSSCFPKLQEVTLNYDDQRTFDQFTSPQVNCLKHVQKLVLQNLGDARWIQTMSEAFPHIQELVWIIKNPGNFNLTAPDVWENFKTVRKLTLDFQMDNPEQNSPDFLCLDEGFTGFSDERCQKFEGDGSKLRDADADKLRINPSILNLKDLSGLRLIFRDQRKDADLGNFMRIRVAGRYAFDKLSLKAMIHVHVQTSRDIQSKYQEVLLPFKSYFYMDWQII